MDTVREGKSEDGYEVPRHNQVLYQPEVNEHPLVIDQIEDEEPNPSGFREVVRRLTGTGPKG